MTALGSELSFAEDRAKDRYADKPTIDVYDWNDCSSHFSMAVNAAWIGKRNMFRV
ncbi:MAG: hypothetical protein ABJ263_03060 [Tateyamaria sp.]|uniref:hypothetical protein n=1 Tax=Tateyamaria sp. TaxID=1929288 RepID=UPI0032887E54